jgi:hypothetical protein
MKCVATERKERFIRVIRDWHFRLQRSNARDWEIHLLTHGRFDYILSKVSSQKYLEVEMANPNSPSSSSLVDVRENAMVTASEAAAILGVTHLTFRRIRDHDSSFPKPAEDVGRVLLYRLRDILVWRLKALESGQITVLGAIRRVAGTAGRRWIAA